MCTVYSIYPFAFIVAPLGIASCAVGIKTCIITTGIKRYKTIIKKTEKHDEMVLRAKTKLNEIEVLISKALFDSYISHDEFILIYNVLKGYDDLNEANNDLKASSVN